MAKKKGKKQKPAQDWTSPPASPKPTTEEPSPSVPELPALAAEATPSDPQPEKESQAPECSPESKSVETVAGTATDEAPKEQHASEETPPAEHESVVKTDKDLHHISEEMKAPEAESIEEPKPVSIASPEEHTSEEEPSSGQEAPAELEPDEPILPEPERLEENLPTNTTTVEPPQVSSDDTQVDCWGFAAPEKDESTEEPTVPQPPAPEPETHVANELDEPVEPVKSEPPASTEHLQPQDTSTNKVLGETEDLASTELPLLPEPQKEEAAIEADKPSSEETSIEKELPTSEVEQQEPEAVTEAAPKVVRTRAPQEGTNDLAAHIAQHPIEQAPAKNVSTASDHGQTLSEAARTEVPPKPEAVKQIVEESRPPAPSPPVSKSRLRHRSAFNDDDEDQDLEEDESALIRPRLRGQVPSRESSRGLYGPPPPPPQTRGPFASRVPMEQYSNGAPPPPPPGYHQGYYPSSTPSYYHSSPHHHSMSSSTGYHNSPPYGTPTHSSSPYQENWSQYPPAYPPYGSSPQRHDSMGSREYHMGPPAIENGSAIEDESGDVFSRISQAIPDLHMLLAKYKETHGQLGVREELLRRASTEQHQRLKQKDDEINHLRDRMEASESKHSTEASRMRLEIGNMEEQVKELKEQIAETEKFRKDAEEMRSALEAAKATWEAKCKEAESSLATLQKATAEEKEKAQKDFDDWKSTTTTKHDAETIALAIQYDKQLKDAEIAAETLRQEAAAARVKENDELREEHQRQQREREASFDRVREELETKLSTAQKDREEALKHERESREVWLAERVTLIKSHQEDRDSLRRGWEDQRKLLEGQYKQKKDESDKAWVELHNDANKKAEEEKAKADKLALELEQLQKKFDDLSAENQKEKETIKSVMGNLDAERARLGKLTECYGDIAEIKSKGDTYYLVSFSQLQKQILDLAATHFVHLPVTPPKEILERIPGELPSFLGNTTASMQLRAAYVAHIVSAMVTFRVFGPFLFSLGRRYDKADSLFASMSSHIREKSTRKESLWRQQTLLAAFTSSGAKQRINTAAGTVVDEIVAEIKHFADPKEEEGIRIAVRRIVKLAAETWRFARLEREMISATMPAIQDDKHGFKGPQFWPAYKADDTPIASLAGTAIVDEPPKLLLRLFPVIHREPRHEKLRMSDEEQPDEGCIYHHGLALYDDAKLVEARREELKAAGLPPITNSSPTAADFPLPMIPPPRNPLPPTPRADSSVLDRSSASALPSSGFPSVTAPSEHSRRSKAKSVRSSATAKSVRSSPDRTSSGDQSIHKSASEKAPTEKASFEKASSDKARSEKALPEKALSEKALSVKAASSSPTLPPASMLSGKSSPHKPHYSRPPPGPVDYSTPRDPPASHQDPLTSADPVQDGSISYATPPPVPTRSPPLPPDGQKADNDAKDVPPNNLDRSPPPLPTPTESGILPASLPPILQETPSEPSTIPPLPAPTESGIIPPSLIPLARTYSPNYKPKPSSSPPTPPRSGAQSPLFAASDEIEALRAHHRARHPSTSRSRKSTPSKPSNEDLHDAPTTRRTSGYALNNPPPTTITTTTTATANPNNPTNTNKTAPSLDASLKTTTTDRSSTSRYTCESRSAAIKALYPNSPLAGAGTQGAGAPVAPGKRTSLRREGRRLSGTMTAGTWDTSTGVVSLEGEVGRGE